MFTAVFFQIEDICYAPIIKKDVEFMSSEKDGII